MSAIGSMKRLVLAALLAAASGCGDPLGSRVEIPASARGSNEHDFEVGDFSIHLERADIGFGPLYMCASTVPSSELCENALAELVPSVTIDGLDGSPQPLPSLEGTTGTVRSAVFDYGISWTLTEAAPEPSAGAPGGHSARFAGTATRGTESFEFVADVDVLVTTAGRMVSGLALDHVIESDPSSLEIVVDPRAYLSDVDFEALSVLATSSDPVRIEQDTPSYDSIVLQMTTTRRIDLRFSR
jgi:hypothetical protein